MVTVTVLQYSSELQKPETQWILSQTFVTKYAFSDFSWKICFHLQTTTTTWLQNKLTV